MRTTLEVTIGYLYKVLKNNLDTSKFKEEFSAIRHGDYEAFLHCVGSKIDFIINYNHGVIDSDVNIKTVDPDFTRLIKVGSSLNSFVKICFLEYGNITDIDLEDEDFERLALFEISLRMHRNNNLPRVERIHLEAVINNIQMIKNLSDTETKILHQGRRFLNNIKHSKKSNYDWKKEILIFNSAYDILMKNRIIL